MRSQSFMELSWGSDVAISNTWKIIVIFHVEIVFSVVEIPIKHSSTSLYRKASNYNVIYSTNLKRWRQMSQWLQPVLSAGKLRMSLLISKPRFKSQNFVKIRALTIICMEKAFIPVWIQMVRFNHFREKDHIFQGAFFFRFNQNFRKFPYNMSITWYQAPCGDISEKNACLCLRRRTVLHGNSVSPCCLPLVYYYIILGMYISIFVCLLYTSICLYVYYFGKISSAILELPSTS